jgi:hypothetical protein
MLPHSVHGNKTLLTNMLPIGPKCPLRMAAKLVTFWLFEHKILPQSPAQKMVDWAGSAHLCE